MDHVKWKMSEADRILFLKSWQDCETELDRLIINEKIRLNKLLSDLETIQTNSKALR
jgi:hypothetical protein